MIDSKRLAAIDIGTNSIRCLVVEAAEPGGYRLLDDEKATVRLGEGLQASGKISAAAWERAREALRRMQQIADGLGVVAVEVVATSAVRKACNGAEFVSAMKAENGIDIRVISGEEEAELAVLSARHHFPMGSTSYALVDIGGGSAELVFATGDAVQGVLSMDLGAVFLTETFLQKDPPGKKEIKALRQQVRNTFHQHLGHRTFHPQQCLIGSGGTITTIGSMLMAQRNESYDSVNRYEVLHSDVVHLLAMLERMPVKDRRHVQGLSPERADIIIAGMLLVDELMNFLGTNILRINERGIREGMILRGLEKYRLIDHAPVKDWSEAVWTLARTCHVDIVHAEQTRLLALEIFDAVADRYGLEERDRTLLEAGAILHDIGYFINYAKHHKHSYHLIRHATLFDFSPREKELIAHIARYHRKSMPKLSHENFGWLSEEDRARVMKLGGVLRLADGLDRRRTQEVVEMTARLDCDDLVLDLVGRHGLEAEIHGGEVKSDLFQKAFGLKVVFHQLNPALFSVG